VIYAKNVAKIPKRRRTHRNCHGLCSQLGIDQGYQLGSEIAPKNVYFPETSEKNGSFVEMHAQSAWLKMAFWPNCGANLAVIAHRNADNCH